MTWAIESAFDDAAERLDSVRATLNVLVAGGSAPGGDPRREVAWAGVKASVYVWLAACLERFLKNFLALLLRDITAATPLYAELKPELLSISGGSVFDSLYHTHKLRKWKARTAVLRQVMEPVEAVFSSTHIPVDGRTIEPEHLEVAWLVYGLPGSPFPGILQKMALVDLSRGRNEVAHGEVRPEQLGRSKTFADLWRLVMHVEDVVQHVYMVGIDYVEMGGFRR